MNRLVAPDIPPSAAPPTAEELSLPPAGMGRDESLRRWQRRMHSPKPSAKELGGELKAWSGEVGRRTWARERYGATAALLMRSPSVRSAHVADWFGVHRACSEAVEPLSRYTAGWSGSFYAIKPRGLNSAIGGVLREQSRAVARNLRPLMCATPSVLETPETVAEFVAEPRQRYERDHDAAMNIYCANVRRFIDRFLAESATRADDDLAAVERVLDHLTRLVDEFDVDLPGPPTTEQSAAAKAQAKKFLDPIAAEYVRKHAHRDATAPQREHFSAAYQSVLITYERRLLKELPLAGTEHYLPLRVRSARIDEWRKRSKESASATAGTGTAAADVDPDVADDAPSASDTLARLTKAAVAIIESDPTLRMPNGIPSWEAHTASEILCGVLRLDITDVPALKRSVAARWEALAPSNSRSHSAGAAAQHVFLIIMTALNRAARDDGAPS